MKMHQCLGVPLASQSGCWVFSATITMNLLGTHGKLVSFRPVAQLVRALP